MVIKGATGAGIVVFAVVTGLLSYVIVGLFLPNHDLMVSIRAISASFLLKDNSY